MECFQLSQELYSCYNKLIGIDCFLFIALVEVCIIRIIMHKFNYKSISLEALINSLLFALISILFILKDVCVFFAICLIVLFVVLMMCRIFECLWEIIKILKIISLVCTLFLVGSTLYIIIDIMLHVFNNGSIYFNKDSSVSTDIGDWGDFATFFGGFFTLISIYLAYRAFMSQISATRRASFDATFAQIFAQHKILYDKALQHKVGNSITWIVIYGDIDNINNQKGVFALCREQYINFENKDIELFWSDFNKVIGQHVSADFKNYFKYIYHEVSLVIQEESIDDEMKKRYIGIIQSQMNNDELLCYMINQMDYYLKDKTHEKNNEYIKNLKEYGFFKEICKKNSGYQDYVLKIIGKTIEDIEEDDVFVKKEWFLYEH